MAIPSQDELTALGRREMRLYPKSGTAYRERGSLLPFILTLLTLISIGLAYLLLIIIW